MVGVDGRPFTTDSIGMAVAMRDLKQQMHEASEIRVFDAGFTRRRRARASSAN